MPIAHCIVTSASAGRVRLLPRPSYRLVVSAPSDGVHDTLCSGILGTPGAVLLLLRAHYVSTLCAPAWHRCNRMLFMSPH